MKLLVYSIYDSKAEAYLRPFFVPTKGLAIRSVTEGLADPHSSLAKHVADYTLFEIGEYDDATGVVTMHKTHENLGVLIGLISQDSANPAEFIWDRQKTNTPKKQPAMEGISNVN